MAPFRSNIVPLIVLAVYPLFFPVTATIGRELPGVTTPRQEDEYNEDWHSHIDNQAYLEQRKRLREEQQSRPPVIIIDRRDRRDSARRDCYYDDCGSWEMEFEYHSPDSSFSYREGYRPNRPVIIRTDPHYHHHNGYLPDNRVQPEGDDR